MKKLQILALLSILSFSLVAFAKDGKDLKVAKTQTTVNNSLPNPFRPVIDIFKKILGIKPKPIICSPPASVEEIILSKTELSIIQNQTIHIHTIAKDPEDDVLTYSYTIPVGNIIGKGEKVTWDLSGVKPGTYTITAAVDDGCGFCGMTKTKTIIVKE